MKTIIEYQCEICKNRYKTEEEAIECEAKGLFNFDNYPLGLLSLKFWGKDQYGVFANLTTTRFDNSHLCSPKLIAYRSWENYNNEIINIWEWEYCGGAHLLDNNASIYSKCEDFDETSLELKQTKWLIMQLKANNIKPCYYNKEGKLIYI